MEKILIEVSGGLIQRIISTSDDIQINVFDSDNVCEENNIDEGWTYWRATADKIVDDYHFEEEIVKAAEL